jgi:heme-binding NEAT domain protein
MKASVECLVITTKRARNKRNQNQHFKWKDPMKARDVDIWMSKKANQNQAKPNQTKPSQTKPNQTKPNQTKPKTKQNKTKQNKTKQNKTKMSYPHGFFYVLFLNSPIPPS